MFVLRYGQRTGRRWWIWRMSTSRETIGNQSSRTNGTFARSVIINGVQVRSAGTVPMAQLMRLVDFDSLSDESVISSDEEDALEQIVKGVKQQSSSSHGVADTKGMIDISFDSFDESSDEGTGTNNVNDRVSSQMSSLGLPIGIEDAIFDREGAIHSSPNKLEDVEVILLSQGSSIFQASLEFLKRGHPERKSEDTKERSQCYSQLEQSQTSRVQLEHGQRSSQHSHSLSQFPPLKVTRGQTRPFSTLAFKEEDDQKPKASDPPPPKLEYRTIQLATQKNPLHKNNNNNNKNNNSNNRDDPFEEGPGQELKTVKPIVLSKEQEHVLSLAKDGVSLFFTGSAGTGKSLLLRTIIKDLKRTHQGKVAITASTGLAACNIGGQTLHSFAGVGLGKGEPQKLLKYVRRNRGAINRWKSIQVLIIDEISMIDRQFFDTLDFIAKKIRHNNKPFGGVQLIICGDFYQLPPVVNRLLPDGSENPDCEVKFAFEANSWKEALSKTIVLKEVFRQKGDQKFIDMLNQMREGTISEEASKEFQRLSRPLPTREGIVPSMLFATRREVDSSNNLRLAKLDGKPLLYSSIDGGTLTPQQKQTVLSNLLAPKALHLKKGAQVMCIKNIDSTIINGTLGQVVDFVSDKNILSEISNEDEAEADAPTSDAPASSSSDFIFADYQNKVTTTVDEEVMTQEEIDHINRKKSLCQEFNSDGSNGKLYPLVRFLMPDGVTTRTVVVYPEKWTVEDEKDEILASRVQLPLILAWSLSIHKSQGQTLQSVIIDLRRVFEAGQTYVGLSRAISRESVQVIGFERNRVRSHPKVINFYRDLQTAEQARTSSSTAVNHHQHKLDFFQSVQMT